MRTGVIFGKLPAHGDFVARGLKAEISDALDRYLSESLVEAETYLRDFDDLYGQAPAWRFLVEIGDGSVAGAIAPSLDRAGRRFPILAGVRSDEGENPSKLSLACETALYDAFAGQTPADELLDNLNRIPSAGSASGEVRNGWWLEDADSTVVDHLWGNRPTGLLKRMMESARLRS